MFCYRAEGKAANGFEQIAENSHLLFSSVWKFSAQYGAEYDSLSDQCGKMLSTWGVASRLYVAGTNRII